MQLPWTESSGLPKPGQAQLLPKMTTFTSGAESLKVRVEYDTVRSILLEEQFEERRLRPLAFWALPSDRGLPFALLDRPLGELIHYSFAELAATPRIGQRKLRMLVTLLQRSVLDEPDRLQNAPTHGMPSECLTNGEFDPALVSELHWAAWCETLRRHELENELLGRLAFSLQALPSVIWRTPLRSYLTQSLAEIRDLRTHGEKRVSAVLQVIFTSHHLLVGAKSSSRFAIRIIPQFAVAIEEWLRQIAQQDELPNVSDVQKALILPMLNQLEVDAGPQIQDLVAERLGLETPPKSVREQAQRLGVTRARIYQLFEMSEEVMNLRWPAGGVYLVELIRRMQDAKADPAAIQLLQKLNELFYPVKSASRMEAPIAETEWNSEQSVVPSRTA